MHESCVKQRLGDHIVGHISRDSTAIDAREKAQKKNKVAAKSSVQNPKRKRGRPKKGEQRVKEPTRLER